MTPSLAIIVPVAAGDHAWYALLPQLQAIGVEEIAIVVQHEEYVSINTEDISVLRSEPGRALQLNTGAASTTSDWLWFLHADSILSAKSVSAMRAFIAADADAIGYFDLVFTDDGPRAVMLNRWGAYLRSRWMRMPFGDQGFLMPRRLFMALGGYDTSVECGEDHALIWTAHKRGVPVEPLGAPLATSARKYARSGWWKTTYRHLRQTLSQARRFSQDGTIQ